MPNNNKHNKPKAVAVSYDKGLYRVLSLTPDRVFYMRLLPLSSPFACGFRTDNGIS